MPRPSITSEKEEAIIAALDRDAHASRVTRALGDVSYATVWRVAARKGIDLAAGRAAKGYKRLPPEQWAKVEDAVRAHPEATQQELARETGVSRATVGRVVRACRQAPAPAG
jgi:hypothetical protein